MHVKKDPKGRPKHWIVEGKLLAGPDTEQEALDLYNEVHVNPQTDEERNREIARQEAERQARRDREILWEDMLAQHAAKRADAADTPAHIKEAAQREVARQGSK